MTNEDTRPTPTEALVASFHHVESLVPADQELLTVPPEMPVSEALQLMKDNDYSQLPVVAGDAVLGVFSYRSFSSRAGTKQKGVAEPLGALPVEDFLDDFEYVHPTQDWNRVRGYLNRDDGFFVGHREGLEGMVTTMDMLNYFREIANPFIMIAEIELSLRRIIETCIGEAALPEAITRSLSSAYPGGNVPSALREMTFDNFVQIISNADNWSHFESMFGQAEQTRKRTNRRLREIGDWRNVVFHFRRRLEKWELEKLVEYREWLQRRVRAFEARRSRTKKPVTSTVAAPSRRKTYSQEMLAACSDEAAQFVRWILDEAEAHNLVIRWRATGFTVRAQLPGRVASIAYVDVPDSFQLYFDNALELSKLEESRWRQQLMAFRVLRPKGTQTFHAEINAPNIPVLRDLFSQLVANVLALARYPLRIQASLDGRTVIAELLDDSGRVLFDGTEYGSVSAAGKAASGWLSANGWTFWQYYNEQAREWRPIDELRKR